MIKRIFLTKDAIAVVLFNTAKVPGTFTADDICIHIGKFAITELHQNYDDLYNT